MSMKNVPAQIHIDSLRQIARMMMDRSPLHNILMDAAQWIEDRYGEVVVPSCEPTFKDYVDAIIRAKHRGSSNWKFEIKAYAYSPGVQTLNEDEVIGLGKLLIERENSREKVVND